MVQLIDSKTKGNHYLFRYPVISIPCTGSSMHNIALRQNKKNTVPAITTHFRHTIDSKYYAPVSITSLFQGDQVFDKSSILVCQNNLHQNNLQKSRQIKTSTSINEVILFCQIKHFLVFTHHMLFSLFEYLVSSFDCHYRSNSTYSHMSICMLTCLSVCTYIYLCIYYEYSYIDISY